MRIYFGLLIFLTLVAPLSFAQNVNPARIYEQSRGTESPVEGVWHVYDHNGNLLREENYHNYRLDGEMKIFYPSGALKELLHYSDGLRQGDDKGYFENGGIEFEDNYEDNDLEGEGVHYYDSGEIESREHYTAGHLNGEKRIFYKNGILKKSMNFVNGVLEGAVTTYGEDGNIIIDEHYEHGNLISHHEYGDNVTYDSKSDSAKDSAPPVAGTEPAAPDEPTKI